MSSSEEDGYGHYKVPPPSKTSPVAVEPTHPSDYIVEQAVSSPLKEQKSPDIKMSSLLLERPVSNTTPVPAPRRSSSNRKMNDDFVELSSEKSSNNCIPRVKDVEQTNFSRSLDSTDSDDMFISQTEVFTSSSTEHTSTSCASAEDLTETEPENICTIIPILHNESTMLVPMARPVPKPRTRTKIQSQNVNSLSSLPLPEVLNQLVEHQQEEKSPTLIEFPDFLVNEAEENKFSHSSSSSAVPDEMEALLNIKVDKYCGLFSGQNKENYSEYTELKYKVNHRVSENFVEFPEFSSDENVEYINSGNVRNDWMLLSSPDSGSVVNVSVSSSQHSLAHTPSYVQIDNSEQTITHTHTPSYVLMDDSEQTHTLTPSQNQLDDNRRTPSQFSSCAQKPSSDHTVNLGYDILNESSCDDVLISEGSFHEFNINTSTDPTMQDIQPLLSKICLNSHELRKETRDDTGHQQKEHQHFNHSEINFMWGDTLKPAQSTQNKVTDKRDEFSTSRLVSEFPVDWDSAFAKPISTDASDVSRSNTYVQVGDTNEPFKASYSHNTHKTAIASTHFKPHEHSQPLIHDVPMSPPTLINKRQNDFSKQNLPPLPRRPNKAAELLPTTAIHASPSKNSSLFQPSTNKDIFGELPTPAFTQTTSSDPFRDSKFDMECHRFNKIQLPCPPSRMPFSDTPEMVKAEVTSQNVICAAAAVHDPSEDPERISRFVIPPPNSNGVCNSGRESPDLTVMEASMNGLPDGGCTRLKVFDSSLLFCSPTSDFLDGDTNNNMTLSRDFLGTVNEANGQFNISWPVLDPSAQPKKNARFGYLFKQGGYKANKGWKKRWVVFQEASLSYYSNNTAHVSKRIIPVRCMVNIETDVKATDKNSFRFKVVTSLKDRVFIFSSETLDDCLTWANTLMAAITEYRRSVKVMEEPPVKPDIEGFIRFGNMAKFYVTITHKMLCYYHSYEDYQMGSPTHEMDMKLASVKVKDHRKLQLSIHYGHFNLIFESDHEMQQWRLAMENAIAEGLADDTVLRKVYVNTSNQYCADCGDENPHWASVNLGIVVCKNCAGIHRMFDYRVSKIRSLRMDTRVWTPSLVELMVTIGNANANAFWEFELPAGAKILPTESMDKRKEFIFKKYKSKKFCMLHPLANQGAALGEELLIAASSDNVLELMKVLFSGSDVMYRKDHGPTAYVVAKDHGQRLIMELLYQNGGDPQTLEQNVIDENRLREDVRLQGFLNKTGPAGKSFEKRWSILEHGALTYYLTEKSKTFKGSIHRKDMHLIQTVESDRIGYPFELSTGLKDNRIFVFSSDCKDDSGEWIRTIGKLMAPVAVMDQVGMIDVKLAGYAFMKESLVDEWHQTFLVFSWRGIYYMNTDLKFDYLDLRKASGIKMQDSSNGYQQRGPCFVISSTGKSVYLQATLARDTEKMYTAFLKAVVSSGTTLIDQALTNENVPVIVENCITHVYMNGLKEKGIYRVAGQNSRVQALLDDFRKDVWSVCMSSYTVQDVSNVLKRFIRELDDSVFGRNNYSSWMNMAGCKDMNNRLMWYKYYLEKMPQINFQTLKRIVLHLVQVSQYEKVNLMSVTNLASCFAPSLMRTAKDEQPILASDGASKEISIMVDLMSNPEYFFDVNENERVIQNNIKQAEKEIQRRILENRMSIVDPAAAGILIPVHLLCREGQSVNILVTEEKTAKDAMDYLKRNKTAPDLGIYVLHEQLFGGALERPLFPEDIIAKTTNRWMEWESWVMADNNVCLCLQGLDLLEKLNVHFNPNHTLLSKHQYCDSKPKSRFKRRVIGFRQCKLALYSDSQGNSELMSWKIEDMTIYLGSMHRKTLPPHRHCLTFTVSGEKYTKPPFGHCVSFETEDELFRWAAVLYAAQHPSGLLSWASA